MALKKIILYILISVISSCGYKHDYNLMPKREHVNNDCAIIQQKLDRLHKKKQNFSKNDKFSFKNMLVLPAILQTARNWNGPKKITQEITALKNASIAKKCNSYKHTPNKKFNNTQNLNNTQNTPSINNNYLDNYYSYQDQNNSYGNSYSPPNTYYDNSYDHSNQYFEESFNNNYNQQPSQNNTPSLEEQKYNHSNNHTQEQANYKQDNSFQNNKKDQLLDKMLKSDDYRKMLKGF